MFSRMLLLLGILALSTLVAWWLWPRPDLSIEVERGGVASVVDHYGRRRPLSDTIFVGGSGARRAVRVINRDTMTHQLALFTADAGSETSYTIPPGTYGGYCSAHAASRHLTVVVR